MATDPVCGMKVTEEKLCSTYAGEKYCFCSQGCKDAFENDPSKYAPKKEKE